MGKFNEINIKNQTYYFFNDMINIKNFQSNLLKMDKSHIKILIFTILVTPQLRHLAIMKMFIV